MLNEQVELEAKEPAHGAWCWRPCLASPWKTLFRLIQALWKIASLALSRQH